MKYLVIILLAISLGSCDVKTTAREAAENLAEAAPQLTEQAIGGDWLGFGITAGTAIVTAILGAWATKSRKDGQIKQIVRGIETHKASLENGDVEKLHDALAEFQTKATEALIKKIRLKGK